MVRRQREVDKQISWGTRARTVRGKLVPHRRLRMSASTRLTNCTMPLWVASATPQVLVSGWLWSYSDGKGAGDQVAFIHLDKKAALSLALVSHLPPQPSLNGSVRILQSGVESPVVHRLAQISSCPTFCWKLDFPLLWKVKPKTTLIHFQVTVSFQRKSLKRHLPDLEEK